MIELKERVVDGKLVSTLIDDGGKRGKRGLMTIEGKHYVLIEDGKWACVNEGDYRAELD